jgi:hypothetical protein
MQSFLQYRKFGKAVDEEQERHQLARTNRTNRPSSSSSSYTSVSSKASNTSDNSTDLEKAGDTSDNEGAKITYEGMRLPQGVKAMERSELEGLEDMQEMQKLKSHSISQNRRDFEETQQPSHEEPPTSLSAATTRTQQSTGAAFGRAITGVNVRDRTTHEGEKGGLVFVVGYQGEKDPLNPHNWGYGIRIFSTVTIAMMRSWWVWRVPWMLLLYLMRQLNLV